MNQKIRAYNENGSVTVLAVVLLMLLTLLGMSAISTSSIETQIAGNEMRYKQAFYAAESAKAYVVWRSDLYGPDNITPGTPHYFPNYTTIPYIPETAVLPTAHPIDVTGTQSFNGQVEYVNSSSPPRGSGYSVGTFKAHNYKMECNGYSSNNTYKNIVVGFYRIGF